MSEWISIQESTPEPNKWFCALYQGSKHVECNVLYDGEVINPENCYFSHWFYIPEQPTEL